MTRPLKTLKLSDLNNSVGENRCIEELNLSGNENLGSTDNLRQLSENFKSKKSLAVLRLGEINLADFGIKLLSSMLLRELPITYLDIQNNNIQDSGFKALVTA
jgi:Ran GTPase-activating protein (RanGAP) involved in mRNA processing and transport